MKTPKDAATGKRAVDDQMNELFQSLLRDAAEKREGRQRVHSLEDATASRLESTAILALARGGATAGKR